MSSQGFCDALVEIYPPFYPSVDPPCTSGSLSFGLNFSFAVVVSLICLVSLLDQLKKIIPFTDSKSFSLLNILHFITTSDTDERCKLVFSLLATMLSLLYIIGQWAFQLGNFWLTSCIQQESSGFFWVGPCRWVNSLLYCLKSLPQVSLLLLFNLYWFWQYNRTRNAVRPFRQVLCESGVLSMAFTLLLCLDLLLQISLESCEFFWRIVTFLVIATQVTLTLSFTLGWVVFIRKIPKIGSSAQARRVSKAFFFQTSVAMFLFTYEALFNLITTIFPFYFPFNCFWSIFLIFQSVVVVTLPLLILTYSVTPSHSILFCPCRRFGYTHQSEFPTLRDSKPLLPSMNAAEGDLGLDSDASDSRTDG